jgi:hypothetical protein
VRYVALPCAVHREKSFLVVHSYLDVTIPSFSEEEVSQQDVLACIWAYVHESE